MRSIRKPAGVCRIAETALNTVSVRPKFGVAHAVFRAHEGEQRRQHQDVVVADEMRRADAGDQADVAGTPRGRRKIG